MFKQSLLLLILIHLSVGKIIIELDDAVELRGGHGGRAGGGESKPNYTNRGGNTNYNKENYEKNIRGSIVYRECMKKGKKRHIALKRQREYTRRIRPPFKSG